MNLAYFKERFNHTESAYLLARRANSPDLNPYALQAIEDIIIERGEQLPVLAAKPSAESQRLQETKADKVWRFMAMIATSIWIIVLLQTYTTGFIQARAPLIVGFFVLSIWLLLWLSQKNIQSVKESLWRFIHTVVKVFKLKTAVVASNTRTFLGFPIDATMLAVVLSYYVILPNAVVETEHSENWYVYGLIRLDNLDERQKELMPYKIRLVSRSCLVGGDEYEKDMKNNQHVHESAADDLKQLLGKPRTHN
jgi:hypothetical protein